MKLTLILSTLVLSLTSLNGFAAYITCEKTDNICKFTATSSKSSNTIPAGRKKADWTKAGSGRCYYPGQNKTVSNSDCKGYYVQK